MKTDRLVSSVWMALPAAYLLLVVSAVSYFVVASVEVALQDVASNQVAEVAPPFLASLWLLGLAVYAILAVLMVLVYRLIVRRNGHFGRQQALFGDLMALLAARAAERSLSAEFGAQVAPALSTLEEIKAKETQRDAILWVVCSLFVGVLFPLVVYFLMKDYHDHERREERFLEQISVPASSAGMRFSYHGRSKPLPSRSFGLYAVLTFVTFGFFTLYWLYRLIEDPNEHFTSQWDIEDRLYAELNRKALGPENP